MNAFTKIKLARNTKDLLPEVLSNFISEHHEYFEIVSDLKICDNCDYLFWDEKSRRSKFHESEIGDMYFDFEEELRYHRKQHYSLKNEPLAKALGLTQSLDRVIWDATCGTGKDALLISHFGAKVLAFERHPLIYLLLIDAKRIFDVSIDFFFGDSLVLNLSHLPTPSVIYYDPMYPEKKKSALPRKEMQIFKTVVGPDNDSENYLKWAMTKATDRVVVKRSIHAPKILNNVNAEYLGKSTRYDMYKIFISKE